MAISSAEVVRLTVARIMSNGAPVCSMSVTSKRREIASRSRWGTTRSMAWLVLSVARTMARAKADEPYSRCSCSSFWLASESSVSVTCIALRDVQSVRIITTPAPTRKAKLAGTFSLSASIVIAESPAWRAIWKASQPAIGTPMKFTRSFPAKASARAKVPPRIVMRRMLILKRWTKKRMRLHTSQQTSSERMIWFSTIWMKAVCDSVPLSPLKSAK